MIGLINQALFMGYTAAQVLNFLSKKIPSFQQGINNARQQGTSDEKILKYLSSKISNVNENRADEQLNSTDRYLRNAGLKTKEEREQTRNKFLKGALGVGSAALAAYPAIKGLIPPKTPQAIQPSKILPAQQAAQRAQQPTTINLQNRGLPSPPQRGLPAPKIPGGTQASGQILPQPMQPQQPITPPPQPMPSAPVQRDPTKNLQLVKNLQEDKRISNLIQGGLPTNEIAGVLKKILPKEKIKALESGEGGLVQVIEDVASTIQGQQPIPREKDVQEAPIQAQDQQIMEQPRQELDVPQKEIERPKELALNDQVQTPKGNAKIKNIAGKVATVAFEDGKKSQFEVSKLRKLSEIKALKNKEFAIPTYRYLDDTDKDFEDRKTMFSAVEKAAKAISEGKSFLDFPVSEAALKGRSGYSTAEDVLRFMAGIPNIYDPLLDADEKEELTDGLFDLGDMTVDGLRPGKGEASAAYGAAMSPNLVWNLLLSVEPKLAKIDKPKSIKGAKVPGAKMSGTDIRRILTHSVYGALSGKKITTQLADKITKISQAASYSKALIKSFEEGEKRRQEAEMERLMDDEYFLSLFTDEIEEMVKKYR